MAQTYPELAGIVNYASAVAFEVRQNGDTATVTLNFKNGTDDSDFKAYNMFGSNEAAYPLDKFKETLQVRFKGIMERPSQLFPLSANLACPMGLSVPSGSPTVPES